ncbi:hypothetical protein BKA70DRAFT_1369947 [Coprinopsis sp. MPI-PUGE-AT-0042]|nr:hypothetical protein BKA70DRAFT_1369947 [Coprinopsis sp. MPI-PUGE-AT-0042]
MSEVQKRKASELSAERATLDGAQATADSSRPQQRLRLDSDNEAAAVPEPTRHTLAYPRVTDRVDPTPFQLPTQITSFSYDENHQQLFDDSALHYYVDPPPNARLDFAYDRWVRKPDTRGRLDPLLKAIRKAKEDRVKAALVPDNGVVCWRGIMTKILTAPYEERDDWDLNVMFVNGVLYFEEHLTDSKLQDKNNMQPRQRQQTYYGYAFESYCTSETPTRPPWMGVVRTKLGDSRIVIGGEVDCEIVVGFRTPSGVVNTLQKFKTIELPRLVRGKPGAWDPSVCLAWSNNFLTFLKSTLVEDSPRVWRVTFTPGTGVSAHALDDAGVDEVVNGEDRTGFLPSWYWDEIHAARNSPPLATSAQAPPIPSPIQNTHSTTTSSTRTISGWQV